MIHIYYKYKDFVDYMPPLFLFSLIFLDEIDLHKQAFKTSCNSVIYIITFTLFFIFLLKLKYNKYITLLITMILWVGLVYYKKCIFKNLV